MKIKLPIILTVLLAFFLVSTPVKAAVLKLNSIGTLDVSSQLYSHMWYTGSQPTFSGTGTSGATVNITLDGSSYSTTVNTSEQWSWKPPTALANADHTLTFSSGVETVNLTLTTGSNLPTNLTSSTSGQAGNQTSLPQTGFINPTLWTLAIGIILTLFPFWRRLLWKKRSSQ